MGKYDPLGSGAWESSAHVVGLKANTLKDLRGRLHCLAGWRPESDLDLEVRLGASRRLAKEKNEAKACRSVRCRNENLIAGLLHPYRKSIFEKIGSAAKPSLKSNALQGEPIKARVLLLTL
jgi:hypothetical protein